MKVSKSTRRAYALTVLLTLGTFVYGIMSRGFGITLACMANNTDTNSVEPGTSGEDADSTYPGTFDWDSDIQAHLIASFSWGFLAALPFAGFAATPRNAAAVLSIMVFLTSLVVGIFPVATQTTGYLGAVLMRVLAGIFSSLVSTAVDQIVALHIPKTWKTICYALITIGSYFSAVVASLTGGLLCEQNILGGWPLIFYGAAAFGVLWCAVWVASAHCYPSCLFSKDLTLEAGALQESMSVRDKVKDFFNDMADRLPEFRDSVLKTGAFWSLMPCVCAATFTTNLYMNYIPTFFQKSLRISMRQNGIYSALPFIVIIFGIFTFSLLADGLKKGSIHTGNRLIDWLVRPTVTSKILNTIGFTSSGIIIALSTILPDLSADHAAALLAIGAGMYTAVYPGYRINIVTINRRCASIIGAFATFIGTVAAILFPYFVDLIVKDTRNVRDWRVLFCCIAGFDIISAVIYIVFGPGEPNSQVSVAKNVEEGIPLAKNEANPGKAD